MEQNEVNSTGAAKEAAGVNEPKPLKKLVKVNKNIPQSAQGAPGEYRGKYEAESPQPYRGQHEAQPAQPYHGLHEAQPSQPYHGLHEAQPSQPYHGLHEAQPSQPYHGLHEAPTELPDDDEYDYYEKSAPKAWKDIVVKVLSIAASVFIIGAMVLNMPIFVDKNTNKNVSLVYLVKHWQPIAKEGTLDKTDVELNIDTEVVEEDFNDGLDLPQLVEGQYSVLFLGFDEDEFNTDVMWVCQFDIGHAKLNILQIPRDCCLPDYTTSVARKFNSIYSMGDTNIQPPIQRVVNAVQENFGIPIDAYVTTACFDIVEMVDIIGGIPIHLDNEIIYEADKIIPAGDVTLNGQQAEWFIRFRHEWLQGDIGRMQNQRRFMAAAMQKLLSIVSDEGRLKLYSYLKQIYDKELLYTDLTVDDMSKIADFASTLSMDNVQVNMVPGEDAMFYAADGNAYSVYSVHKQATIDMLNKYYRPYQTLMNDWDTSIVELVTDYKYEVYDDTSATLEELEEATEPVRDPNKKPWWKE